MDKTFISIPGKINPMFKGKLPFPNDIEAQPEVGPLPGEKEGGVFVHVEVIQGVDSKQSYLGTGK